MVLSRLTKITGPGISTDTNWVGDNANYTGIVTANSFVGDGSELVGVASTDNIITGTPATFNTYPVSMNAGVNVAGVATFTGNVSIAGTLTYEDVTNIDSVGIITARNDLKVGTGVTITPAGGGFFSGIVTATSFTGDGANITGVAVTEAPVLSYEIFGPNNHQYFWWGGGVDNTEPNPDLFLQRGQMYRFVNNAGSAHPLEIRYAQSGPEFTSGVRGDKTGVQLFTVPYDAPAKLRYQCVPHTNMGGAIYIRGADGNQEKVGLTTFRNAINIQSDDSSPGRIRFYCEVNNIHYVTLKAPAHANFSGYPVVTLPNITGTLLTSNNANISGIVTATGADINGDLDVDGHTNLDNVNIAGVTSVANLTSGRVVLAGTGGKLEDSGNLTFSGSTLTATGGFYVNGTQNASLTSNQLIFDRGGYSYIDQINDSGSLVFRVTSANTNALRLDSSAQAHFGSSLIIPDAIQHNGDLDTKIRFPGTDTISFETASNERLRINADGYIGVGSDDWGSYDSNARNVLIASSGNTGITIRSGGATPFAMIHFADGTSNANEYRAGRIIYQHELDSMSFHTANVERARIDGNGEFQIQHFSPPDGSSASRAARSALEIKRHYPQKTSGNYWIKDNNGTARQIYCEMETDGGGWMLWNDYNRSQTSMNEALGGSSTAPSSNLARSNYNNYAYYTVWIRASDIDSTGERLHSFVQLDQDGEIKYVADYGADFFYENVGDQFQPDRSDYFASDSSSEYIQMDRAYQPQLGASGWQQFSNGGWQEVYIREMDTRISPGDHRSLHLVDRIYGFDSNGVPRWTISESMHPLPFWGDISLFSGEVADGNQNIIQNGQREIRANSGNNGPASQGRSIGVFTGSFEIEFQLGQLWGWSIGALNSSIQVAANIRANITTPYQHFVNHYSLTTGNSTPYALYSLYNNSSNNMWMPVSQNQFQAYSEQTYSGGNSGSNVIWRTDDGTIRVTCKSGSQSHGPYTFPTKFAGPLIFSSGQQGPHSTFIYDCWNSTNTGATIGGRNKWYK